MRQLLLLMVILLSGCHTTHQNSLARNLYTQKKVSSSQKHRTALYERYKYKKNRYLQKQDAAPLRQQEITFKEPVPAVEPISRYGNPAEYDVDGQTYEILKNSKGYKSRGIASWYGTKFHKQRTSSGEPYNMYVMTAAHKTLPLPTYIKVKNLMNGREAVVKVNDRGPFHSDRILDLSYAAAVKLGIYPKGTAPVEIETIMGPVTRSQYYIQAGAFSSEFSANKLREKLKKITPVPVRIEHYQQHYVVRLGPFGDKYMVDTLKVKLANNGVMGTFSVLI